MGKSKAKSSSRPSSAPPTSDLTQLVDITDDEIVATLQSNSSSQPPRPYTSVGSTVLVAVNSNDEAIVKNISDDALQKSWHKDYKDTNEQSIEKAKPPHIWGIVNSAYLNLRRTGKDQAIIISGESGTGKTFQADLALRQLCSVSGSSKKDDRVQKRVTAAQQVLHAFGNAKTATTNDSSRFGSYVEYQFNERGKMIGCKQLSYIFDKDRVVSYNQAERNFHIFYYLLAGASPEQRSHFHLGDISAYHYMTQGELLIPGVDDRTEFSKLKESLKAIGLGKKSQAQIFQVLAAILHLSTIQFIHLSHEKQDACSVKNTETLELVADFLGLHASQLESALTCKTALMGNDLVTVFLNPDQAEAHRDNLAKILYRLLFEWIVEYINTRLCKDSFTNFVSILDLRGTQVDGAKIRGFDTFQVNYANEILQNFINNRLFDHGLAELLFEGIQVTKPSYTDNASAVELLKSVTEVIDSFSSKANNKDSVTQLVESVQNKHEKNPAYSSTKGPTTFGINHYNTTVIYNASRLLEKNSDSLSGDFISLFKQNSTNDYIRKLFSDQFVAVERFKSQKTIVGGQTNIRRAPSMRKKKTDDVASPNKENKPDVKPLSTPLSTLSLSLSTLVDTLDTANCWIVFCLAPSDSSAADFDLKKVKTQVKNFNLPEFTRHTVFLGGDYTVRYNFEDFLTRYQQLFTSLAIDESKPAKQRIEQIGVLKSWGPHELFIGKSLVVLSQATWRNLENGLRKLEHEAKRKDKEGRKKKTAADDADNESIKSDGETLNIARNSSFGNGTNDILPAKARPYYRQSVDGRTEYSFTDNESYYSDDNYTDMDSDRGSVFGGENDSIFGGPGITNGAGQFTDNMSQTGSQLTSVKHGDLDAEIHLRNLKIQDAITGNGGVAIGAEPEKREVSAARKRWIAMVWLFTWWIPTYLLVCCGMKRQDIRMAWREKVAICIVIFWISAFVMFYIVGLGIIICPRQNIYSPEQLKFKNTDKQPYVAIYGAVYDLNYYYNLGAFHSVELMQEFKGLDITAGFPRTPAYYCEYARQFAPTATPLFNDKQNLNGSAIAKHHRSFYARNLYNAELAIDFHLRSSVKANLGWDPEAVKSLSDGKNAKQRRMYIINSRVYDLQPYWDWRNGQISYIPEEVMIILGSKPGEDLTLDEKFMAIWNRDKPLRDCFNNLFVVGVVDYRQSTRCKFANYVLLASSIFLVSIIGFKFLAALQFGARRQPEEHDKFVILQVPCYTEGEDSLRKTIDSLAVLRYDDKRKLMFIVCDGNIVGAGNDRSTPRIVLDILGVDPSIDPEPLSFQSVGEGSKQYNMGKVYSGLYEVSGHLVPYLVIVKVGKPTERSKPGNRGKRDSQMVLMRFLNKVYYDYPMSPLELEMYHQIKNVIGVNPHFYEYVLMVDADTTVFTDALNRMVSVMLHNTRVMGVCGETRLANEKETWTTMIQVYEYYISHHLAKAFESMFGSVTCLPGCFCMYRLRSPAKNSPLLVANSIVQDYGDCNVDTLHKKNLLHLGEDRFLTTLMLKHFPDQKTVFTAEAKCLTHAPERWNVFLSQRRRWINSTIHNLLELLYIPQLCGFCCFSMRFVVFIDLFATLIQPATVLYLFYLLYLIISSAIYDDENSIPVISLILLAAIYGLQAFLFLVKREWQHVGWMFVYIFAIPVFSFALPLYAFWYMDDFSWGNTRIVVDADGKKVYIPQEEVDDSYNVKMIPQKRWAEYEAELWELGSQGSRNSDHSERTALTQRTHQTLAAGNRGSYTPTNYGTSVYGGDIASYYSPSPAAPLTPSLTPQPSRLSMAMSMTPPNYDDLRMSRSIATPSEFGMPTGPGNRVSLNSGFSDLPDMNGTGAGRGLSYDNGMAIPGMPTDQEILMEIKRILATANLMSITKKQVRDELSALFNVDLSSKKEYINNCIEAVLQGQA
ncbi:chitin synthase-domain-containing protein [Paraphysoderma sedebokerense]|nr:chitin synthase-domain-containing protein [Paraphysoderma sedebokerense]